MLNLKYNFTVSPSSFKSIKHFKHSFFCILSHSFNGTTDCKIEVKTTLQTDASIIWQNSPGLA